MPNRVLRDWTTSESIDKLSQGAEIFFTRLIMKADDFGNYTANWKLLKSALFPLREHNEAQIEVWIDECQLAGIIKKYEVEGKQYLTIPNFNQRLRAMKGHYPDISQSNDGHVSVNCRPETKRNEVEKEVETKRDMKISDFEKFFDEIWKEQILMMPVHKGKSIDEAIQKAFLHLQAGGRLERGTGTEFKQCVQAFLNNEKFNGKEKNQTKWKV